MFIGDKLLELRKNKGLSQEEVAEKLNVTRQTVSKWETNQSNPDFDKIAAICELYSISADELLTGNKKEKVVAKTNTCKERAKGISIGILIYFVAITWIMIAIPVLLINPVAAAAIFILLCGVATYKIVYTCMVYKKEKKKEVEKPIIKRINNIIEIFILIIYFIVSFITMAWHITWVLFIVCGLLEEIVKLVFTIRGEGNEKE